MNKKYIYLFCIITSLLFVGCRKEVNKQIDSSERNPIESEEGNEINSEILDGPKELNSEFMVRYFTVYAEEKPAMIFEMKDKNTDSFSYIISRMQDDFSWKSEKLEWNNKKVKKKNLTLISVAMNEKNELWGVFVNAQNLADGNTSTTLIKLYSNGDSEEVTIKEGKDKGMLQNIVFVSDSKLVLQYLIIESLSGSENANSPYNTMIYDTINETVLLEDNNVGFLSANIDENLIVCDTDSTNKCIIGKKIGEKVPEFALNCKDKLPTSYSILKKDDSIYYMLDDGIYSGNISDKECKKLISSEDMILPSKTDLNEEIKQYSDNITNDMAIVLLYKMPGEDKEFLCLTKKAFDSQEVQWIHYYI